jgi:pimeloyl-ACP methyl ester carboxylesterase
MSPLLTAKQLRLTRHIASIDGIRTAYWEAGTAGATPIIMLHGLNGSHHGLLPLATHLTDYHLFLPDLPAHGGSAVPRRAVVADVVGWFDAYIRRITEKTGKTPVVLAHSFGAQIAFMTCQQLPHGYSKCILITPVPRVSILPYLFGKSLSLLPSRLVLDVVLNNKSVRAWRSTYLLHRRTPTSEATVKWIADSAASQSDKQAYYVAIAQELMVIPAFNRTNVKKGRFYCIAGDNDKMLTPDTLAQQRQMFGHGHFFICRDTGHLMPIEAPNETAIIVRRLLPPATDTD